MEIRELKYFLAVAREQSISKAASFLYMTQPSLSRQMQNLEKEIGKQLFVRSSTKITLTDAGMLLRKRAEELLELYDKTTAEITAPQGTVSGEVHIGGGESYAIETISKTAKQVQQVHPNIRFNIYSGDSVAVSERLDKGLLDFGVLVEPADLTKYNYIRLPQRDTWGVLMRSDCDLAQKEYLTPEDLYDLPLIGSRHMTEKTAVSDWFQRDVSQLNFVVTYNLMYNASLFAKEGVGYVIGLDRIINTAADSQLTFRPFKPKVESSLAVAWKRYQVFSKPAEIFLEYLKHTIEDNSLPQ